MYLLILDNKLSTIFLSLFSINCTQFLLILFFFRASLKRLAKILLEFNASEPPLKIEQFPDFKHNAATSAVTFGLLS